MLQTPTVTTTRVGDVAWVTISNPPVNATSLSVRQGLVQAVKDVQGARVAILRCDGRSFVAGGDITEFDAPPVAPHLPDVIQLIEDSETPFLALLHGTVLGGGFEIAMGCAWRIATATTRFGLPEVTLGLIPGAGGTQRLPRLVGMSAAIDIACSGTMITAQALHDLDGLDAIADDLDQVAEAFVASLPARPMPVSARTVPPYDPALLQDAKAKLTKRAKGQRSPLEVLDALTWSQESFQTGQSQERTRFLELKNSAESRALRHVFFAERQAAKPSSIKDMKPRNIQKVAIVGGGLMGAGIATAALSSGLNVILIERDDQAAATASDRVQKLLDGAAKYGKMTSAQAQNAFALFAASSDYNAASEADLAIEAVFEDVATKQQVFSSLASVMNPNAILATNTSYLDPRTIFEGISNQSRCIGLHFFSPAHIMKLLEIVTMPETSAEVIATGFALGKRMRKTTVQSGICDGFIGNRMLMAYRREADYLLADGALPHEVDAAVRAFGMPMGPYEVQDLTGLQIAWANRKRNATTRDPAERYVTIADQLCEIGRLGQQSAAGWYRYEAGNRTPQRDPEVEQLVAAYSQAQGITRRNFTPQEIADRLLAVLANEGALIVQDGIAERASDVDVVQIHGYGFPRWRGGPMQYATEIGWEKTAQNMQLVNDESPNSWRLARSEQIEK